MSFFKYFKRLTLEKTDKTNRRKSKSISISEPSDMRTIFSVKFDPETNSFNGLPPELEILLKQHGLDFNAETSTNLPQIFRAYKKSLKQPSKLFD